VLSRAPVQDVNTYTQSNNQLGMLTLGLTFF
jgi:hypothetical protein